MQHFKQSDNDIQIWMAENDNIIEKVRFSDVSTYVVVVDCGLTSHSAIFQLYSNGTDVQFPNFDLLPGTHAIGSLGSLACRAYLDKGTGTSEDVFYLLAIRGPKRGEGKRGIEPGSSDPKSSLLPLRHRGGLLPT